VHRLNGHPVSGLWFEELVPGLVMDHAITRTITETDNVLFTAMTMNPDLQHLDAHFSADTEFGQRLVNSMFTIALLVGICVHELTMGTTVANLGFDDVRFPAPLFHGDTLHAQTTVVDARLSRSRPGQGIVTLEHRGYKQDDTLVVTCRRSALQLCRPQD
jgi:acyl dehydratase